MTTERAQCNKHHPHQGRSVTNSPRGIIATATLSLSPSPHLGYRLHQHQHPAQSSLEPCQLLPRVKAGRPPALQEPPEVAQRSPGLGPGGRGAPFRSWAPPPLRGGRPKGPARPSGPNMCEPLSQGVLPHGGTPPAPGAPGVCVGGRQIGTGGAPAPILGACDGGPQIEGGPGPTTASAGAWSPMRGAGDLVNPSRAAPWGV